MLKCTAQSCWYCSCLQAYKKSVNGQQRIWKHLHCTGSTDCVGGQSKEFMCRWKLKTIYSIWHTSACSWQLRRISNKTSYCISERNACSLHISKRACRACNADAARPGLSELARILQASSAAAPTPWTPSLPAYVHRFHSMTVLHVAK